MDPLPLKTSENMPHIAEPANVRGMSDAEKSRVYDAAKQFESLLTSMMFKSMTETTEGFFGGDEGMGGDTFGALFHQQLGDFVTENRGIGVAEKLYRQLTGENLAPETRLKLDKLKDADLEALGKMSGRPLPEAAQTVEEHGVPAALEQRGVLKNARSLFAEYTKDVPAIEPSRQSLRRLSQFDSIVEENARRFGAPPNLIRSIILAESAANPKAQSHANAKGLMQLMDGTARHMGVENPWDPRQNIYGGAKYISMMLDRYDGDLERALAAYNAGPGNVDKYDGVPPFKETQTYVKRVIGYYNHLDA
jgi:soluble lytic murein transglycosylase-like protein